mmetsp:Transcript_55831/g.103321  ORF Transcript_55831/g.103321 Transcript_55831/m.103321 type:complete len:240 (-) Transcript_55831:349-1068(-)
MPQPISQSRPSRSSLRQYSLHHVKRVPPRFGRQNPSFAGSTITGSREQMSTMAQADGTNTRTTAKLAQSDLNSQGCHGSKRCPPRPPSAFHAMENLRGKSSISLQGHELQDQAARILAHQGPNFAEVPLPKNNRNRRANRRRVPAILNLAEGELIGARTAHYHGFGCGQEAPVVCLLPHLSQHIADKVGLHVPANHCRALPYLHGLVVESEFQQCLIKFSKQDEPAGSGLCVDQRVGLM